MHARFVGFLIGASALALLGCGAGGPPKKHMDPPDYLAATRGAEYRPTIQKLADAIEKKQEAGRKQLMEETANCGVLGLMNTMNERDAAGKRKVFGVGKSHGDVTPDGIEAKIQQLSDNLVSQETLERESRDLVAMAYRVAAIAEAAKISPFEFDSKRTQKDWTA
jgi:hypothetical protein